MTVGLLKYGAIGIGAYFLLTNKAVKAIVEPKLKAAKLGSTKLTHLTIPEPIDSYMGGGNYDSQIPDFESGNGGWYDEPSSGSEYGGEYSIGSPTVGGRTPVQSWFNSIINTVFGAPVLDTGIVEGTINPEFISGELHPAYTTPDSPYLVPKIQDDFEDAPIDTIDLAEPDYFEDAPVDLTDFGVDTSDFQSEDSGGSEGTGDDGGGDLSGGDDTGDWGDWGDATDADW